MKNKGFTLVELIMVIFIIAVITTAGFSVYKVWQNKNNVVNGERILISALHEAKSMALLGNNDSNWGVKYLSTQIVVFSGVSYTNRDTSKDKVFDLPIGLTISDLDEFIFIKFTGLPQSILNSTISYGGESRTVTVNAQGVFNN